MDVRAACEHARSQPCPECGGKGTVIERWSGTVKTVLIVECDRCHCEFELVYPYEPEGA
jgi:DnaJ-class molecular chaperone